MKSVALLRGINVGGNKKVPMKELKHLLEEQGFTEVKTLLNSGNVVFEGKKISSGALSKLLEDHFGFAIPTIVRPFADIEKITRAEPFKKIKVTPKKRLYISFLSAKSTEEIKIPYVSADKSFKIIQVTDHAVFSVLDLAKNKTPSAMMILEKTFGKAITTRNYNTVVKLAGM